METIKECKEEVYIMNRKSRKKERKGKKRGQWKEYQTRTDGKPVTIRTNHFLQIHSGWPKALSNPSNLGD
jgi:hypothetical protein